MRLLTFVMFCLIFTFIPQGTALATVTHPPFAAHRGDHLGGLKEESLAALISGLDKGSHWADIDIRPSLSGGLYLYHDGGYVEKHTSAYLEANGVPSLKAVLAGLKAHGTPLVSAEIKSAKWDTYKRAAALFKNYGGSKVMVSSYSRTTLNAYRKEYPAGKVTLNSMVAQPASYYVKYQSASIDMSIVSDEYVASLKAAGLPVYVFTPNSSVDWNRVPAGVDGVWTDNVDDYVAYTGS